MEAGYLVEWWPSDGSLPNLEHRRSDEEAKQLVLRKMEEGLKVRAFAVMEIFQHVNARVAKLPDEQRRYVAKVVASQVQTPLTPVRQPPGGRGD